MINPIKRFSKIEIKDISLDIFFCRVTHQTRVVGPYWKKYFPSASNAALDLRFWAASDAWGKYFSSTAPSYLDCERSLLSAIYFKNKLESTTNSKEGWQPINLLLNKKSKSTLINELKIGDSIVTGDKNIATAFNNYFSTIGEKLSENLSCNNTDPLNYVTPVTEVFELNNITMDELRCEIFKAKAGKSTGLDKISNKLLKAAGETIIGSLSQIFNLSIDIGIFQMIWDTLR